MNITYLEIIQATFELLGMALCVATIVILVIKGINKITAAFLNLAICCAVVLTCDACAYIFRGNVNTLSVIMTRVSNFGVFLLNIVFLLAYAYYLYRRLEEKNIKISRAYIVIEAVLVVIAVATLLVNVFNGWMYYFDENNYYHRNSVWYLYAAVLVIALCTLFALTIRVRKAFRKVSFYLIFFCELLPIIAAAIQSVVYGYSFICIGQALAFAILLVDYLYEWTNEKKDDDQSKQGEHSLFMMLTMFASMAVVMGVSVMGSTLVIKNFAINVSRENSKNIMSAVSNSVESELLRPITVSETITQDYNLKSILANSGKVSPESIKDDMKEYLESIRSGFGYQTVFVASEKTRAYYTYKGIGKFLNPSNDAHDIWYDDFKNLDKKYELNVDTDLDNNSELSIFVNAKITANNGDILGVCGVAINMADVANMLKKYENRYGVNICLVDSNGQIQVATDMTRIKNEVIDYFNLSGIESDEEHYDVIDGNNVIVKYMDDMDWYLIIQDNVPEKIAIQKYVFPIIMIFIIGLGVMGILFWVLYVREKSTLSQLHKEQIESLTDKLTGMFNRKAYQEDVGRMVMNNTPLDDTVVIVMDINGLKTVNDTIGHAAGDELLVGAARCISVSLGELGKIYRTGGDEFVMIGHLGDKGIDNILNKFDIITSQWSGDTVDELSISKGVAKGSDYPTMSIGELIGQADRLMYEDKNDYYRRTGKNRRMTW